MKRLIVLALFVNIFFDTNAQDVLPKEIEWSGLSETLIVNKNDPWCTDFESMGFNFSPNYDQTNRWLQKLAASSEFLSVKSIGKSPQGRDILMVIASKDLGFHSGVPSSKACLLVQAGIHAGEIDGKDAGMMLLRDIAHRGKDSILDNVNLLFIPILNVDGHEMQSEYSRANQRGPKLMGWRTNANNLNLNRDYSKLDTPEILAVIDVINQFKPDLYIDMHVTDGADYQYDLTFGFNPYASYSKQISTWLIDKYQPSVYRALSSFGHIPGPFINARNGMDFRDGIIDYNLGARFSNSYGDIRRLPSILLENHSLKPYKQRVLGSYIFIEQSLDVLSKNIESLRKAVEFDSGDYPNSVALEYSYSNISNDSLDFLGVESQRLKSQVLGFEYVEWTGKKYSDKLPYYYPKVAKNIVEIPQYYIIGKEWTDIIDRVKQHGIEFEILKDTLKGSFTFYKVIDYKFSNSSNEGRTVFDFAEFEQIEHEKVFVPGSIKISTKQKSRILITFLFDPRSKDSFFAWGFFNSVLSRTEYVESYVIEPLAKQMFKENPKLRREFEKKKREDVNFANSSYAVYNWIYSNSKYSDKNWKVIPVAIIN